MEPTKNLFGGFHIMCQIMDYPLKLMRIYLKTLVLFMAYYDQT
jgi:hypothetical protein